MLIRTADDWTRAARRAAGEGTDVLPVATVDDRLFVGPLTIAGRFGACAHCARRRMEATGRLPVSEEGTDEDEMHRRLPPLLTDDTLVHLFDHVAEVDGRGSVSLHRVVPLAWCPVCGGASRAPEPPHGQTADDPTDEGPFAGWVDPITGVIPALLPDPPDAATGFPFVLTAVPPQVVDEQGVRRRFEAGWGKGDTPVGAVLSAVGEAIERYSPSLPDPRRIVWATSADLDGERFDLTAFPLYTSEQYSRPGFPYPPPDPTVAHPWVRGQMLGTGTSVWIPAVLAYLSLTIGPENDVCQGTSNGLAAGLDTDDATRRALFELVERDALMTAWLTGTPGRRLVADDSNRSHDSDPVVAKVTQTLHGLGATVQAYVLPTSVIGTTVLALAFGDGIAWPGVTIGVAAAADAHAAHRAALLELGQTGPYLRHLHRIGSCPVREPADVVEVIDHARYWFDPARTADLVQRLCDDQDTVELSSLPTVSATDRLAWCAEALRERRIRVALVDVTSPDVATGPFRVVRAVSPDLQPISYGYGLDRVPVARIAHRIIDQAPPIHPLW